MKFDFVGKRYWYFTLSLVLLILSLASVATQGFNLGIDFTGGTLLDLKFSRPVTVIEVRGVLADYNLENSVIQLASTEQQQDQSPNVLVRSHVLSEDERRQVLTGFETKLGAFEVLRVEKVGAVVGSELTKQAIFALLISWALMVVYIAYRFEFKFAVSGIVGVAYNVFIVIGAFSLLRKEIDASFVAALLTVVGYSINDTIVIFDRIRENLKTYKKSDGLEELVNRSIRQTLTRSIYTVLTVLFAAGAIYLFGGETTKNFSLALIIGFVSGAYSSLFIASQLWVSWRLYEDKQRLALKIKGSK